MSDWSTYYDSNPIGVIDRNRWTLYDAAMAVKFYRSSIFTPLVTWATLESLGAQNAPLYVTGRELLQPMTNHNPIGLRQRYLDALYMDTRERHIVANNHYGSKVQFERYDPLINMWRNGGSQGFISGILDQVLGNTVVWTHEKLCRDAIINNTAVQTYAGGATDATSMAATSDYKFDLRELRKIALKLSVRSRFALQAWGDYANPVPGSNDKLFITTPGVIFDTQDQMEAEWMQDLRDLGDERILNGGVIRYQGWTFVESWDAALWNAGIVQKQVVVTQPITAGDGAPDPTVEAVGSTWYTGQASSGIKHYAQCSDIGTSQFAVGDFITLHTARTTKFGVLDGADYQDGRSLLLEVLEVDEVNERLVFRTPIMGDFQDGFSVTEVGTTAGSTAYGPGTGYAFITKGATLNPAYMFGARGGNFFAIRQGVEMHTPDPIDDLQMVQRVSWDLYGGMNRWQPDLNEINWVRASFANRGAVSIA